MKLHSAHFLSLLLTACSCAPAESAVAEFTVESFLSTGSRMVGETITIRGFFSPLYPTLAISSAENDLSIGQVVYVMDLVLRPKGEYERGRNGEALVLEDNGCAPNYAAVTGLVGATAYGTIGLTRIYRVDTFPDSSFSGGGSTCFVTD